jgi:hypothetical protein
MIPNQIGLDGDVTPPEYMAEVKLSTTTIVLPRTIFNRFGIKIERDILHRLGYETHVTIKLPLRRRVMWAFNFDAYAMGKPALFLAFGRVQITRTGWHARGQIIHVDTKPLDMGESLAVARQIKRGEKPRHPGPRPFSE